MASDDDQPLYADDDFDLAPDDDDSDRFISTVPDEAFSSSDEDDDLTALTAAANSTAVTVAIPSSSSSISVAIPPPLDSSSSAAVAVTVALPEPQRPEKKPVDDTRRLFQRLWTDDDEIELLQGFLEYTASRGTNSSGHHHDTAAFYDQIKSKLQLEFNKNQLVEKLRRLKKKFRNVVSKMSSGKEFVFKSPHDQATFELSRKIWSNFSPNYRAVADLVVDDDEQTPPRAGNCGFGVNHINFNSTTGAGAGAMAMAIPMVVDHKASGGIYNSSSSNNNNAVAFDAMMSNYNSPVAKLSTRKRPRVAIKDEKGGNVSDNSNVINNNMSNANINNNVGSGSGNVNLGSTMQGLIEEAVRSCLSPMLKDLVNSAVNGAVFGGGGGGGGSAIKGVGALAMNAVPLNFTMPNVGGSSGGNVMDEKWRKQQILELEVYSKRLELVQDQIKLSLEELKSMGS